MSNQKFLLGDNPSVCTNGLQRKDQFLLCAMLIFVYDQRGLAFLILLVLLVVVQHQIEFLLSRFWGGSGRVVERLMLDRFRIGIHVCGNGCSCGLFHS
jgi:hypothetical protein